MEQQQIWIGSNALNPKSKQPPAVISENKNFNVEIGVFLIIIGFQIALS
jgi:hypothetical protein